VEAAAGATQGATSGGRSGGKPGSFHRSAYLTPPLAHSGQPGVIADASAILIELGQSGGPNPNGDRSVSSLLSRQLDAAGFDVSTWSDLAGFEVAVLHPGRTLIEKLLRINNFACDPAAQKGVHGWPRIGRRFYGVWARLGTQEVLHFLGDRPLVSDVLTSCYEMSQAFTPELPVPQGGFGASPAFDASGPLASRFRSEHEAAMEGPYYGTDVPPSFDHVLTRVQEHQTLLDPGLAYDGAEHAHGHG